MDVRQAVAAAYRRAYEDHPGLEAFERRRRRILWGMFLLAAALRLVSLAPLLLTGASPVGVAVSALVGLCLPGIFALAVYRGPWTLSLILLLPAANVALDLLKNGLPALASGERYLPLYYVLLALEGGYLLVLLALTAWLTIPARNRAFAQVLHGVARELGQRGGRL